MMNREIRRVATQEDYAGPEFSDLNLWLPELFRLTLLRTRQNVLRDLTFHNCMLEGPAVMLAISGVRLESCNVCDSRGDMRNLLLRPMAADTVTGAIAFKDCSFVDCDFYAVGFTGAEWFLQELLQIPTPTTAESTA